MSKKPKVNVLPIEQGATLDPQNANKHTAKGGALLENSLQRRGAFRLAAQGKFDRMVALRAGKIVDVSLEEVTAITKRVDINDDAILTARGMGVSFGDE